MFLKTVEAKKLKHSENSVEAKKLKHSENGVEAKKLKQFKKRCRSKKKLKHSKIGEIISPYSSLKMTQKTV